MVLSIIISDLARYVTYFEPFIYKIPHYCLRTSIRFLLQVMLFSITTANTVSRCEGGYVLYFFFPCLECGDVVLHIFTVGNLAV